VGRGSDLCGELVRLRVRGLCHRRHQPVHRGLAGLAVAAHRPGLGRAGDGDLAAPRCPGWPGASLGQGQPGQFTSWAFSQRAKASGLVPSMGSVGACSDNAMIESFWSRMQVELLNRRRWRTRLELANAILTIWRSSITGSAATAHSACSAQSSSRLPSPPPSHEAIQLPDSTQPGACLSLR
jgi:transposase InsO family protein